MNILDDIIDDKEYSKIVGFDILLIEASQSSNWMVDINETLSNTPFNESIIESFCLIPHGFTEDLDSGDNHDRLFEFVYGLVGFSLVKFLLNNDRRKIKRCQKCDTFYISKTI